MFVIKRIVEPNSGINVHFIRNTQGGFNTTTGFSSIPRFTAPLQDYSLFVRTHNNTNSNARDEEGIHSTFAHELGHNIGLVHTHHPGRLLSLMFNDDNASISNGCYQEAVWRGRENRFLSGCFNTGGKKKARINGDFLEDTEADPNVSGLVNDSTCIFTPPPSGNYRTDNWSTIWTPNTHNIMSYTSPTCRDFFTEQQLGVMWLEMPQLKTFIGYQEPKINLSASTVCYGSSTSLSLVNVPTNNVSITWQASPANLVTASSGVGATAILQPTSAYSSGNVTVTYTVLGDDDCYVVEYEKNVHVSAAPVQPVIVVPAEPINCNYNALAFAVVTPGDLNYDWKITNGTILSEDDGEIQMSVNCPPRLVPDYLILEVKVSNACGNTPYTKSLFDVSTGGWINPLSVFPNPVDDILNVNLKEIFKDKKRNTVKIHLYNNSNRVVFKTKTSKANLRIPTGEMQEGNYVLKVEVSGSKAFTKHVVIKH